VCLLALAPPTGGVATTLLTNPGLIAATRQLALPLVVVEEDEDGPLPEAVARCGADVLYLQTTLANPTTRTIPARRREALAEACERSGLWIVEDDPLGQLMPDRPDPLATLAPQRTCYVASAAKVLALGLRVGILSAPEQLYPRVAAALRSTTWLTAPLLTEVLSRWVDDGTADRLVAARRAAVAARQSLAATALADVDVVTTAGAPHLWLPLAPPWSGDELAAAARQRGVLLAPEGDFAAAPAAAPGVRLGLNAELDDDQLRSALLTVVTLLSGSPG
jgi:DNA-binding transcriptional MocR family regulator